MSTRSSGAGATHADRRRALGESPQDGSGLCRVLRRRRRRHRVPSRSHEHGSHLDVAGLVRLREQRVRSSHAGRVRGCDREHRRSGALPTDMPGEVVDGQDVDGRLRCRSTGRAARTCGPGSDADRMQDLPVLRPPSGRQPAALSDGRRRGALREIATASSGFGEDVLVTCADDGRRDRSDRRAGQTLDRRGRPRSPRPVPLPEPAELYRHVYVDAGAPWIATAVASS